MVRSHQAASRAIGGSAALVVILASALVLSPAGRLSAQAPGGSVTGVVMDVDGAVLSEVSVRCVALDIDVRSGATGGFRLDGFSPGQHEITIHRDGYAPFTKVVSILFAGYVRDLGAVRLRLAQEGAPLSAADAAAVGAGTTYTYEGRFEGGEIRPHEAFVTGSVTLVSRGEGYSGIIRTDRGACQFYEPATDAGRLRIACQDYLFQFTMGEDGPTQGTVSLPASNIMSTQGGCKQFAKSGFCLDYEEVLPTRPTEPTARLRFKRF